MSPCFHTHGCIGGKSTFKHTSATSGCKTPSVSGVQARLAAADGRGVDPGSVRVRGTCCATATAEAGRIKASRQLFAGKAGRSGWHVHLCQVSSFGATGPWQTAGDSQPPPRILTGLSMSQCHTYGYVACTACYGQSMATSQPKREKHLRAFNCILGSTQCTEGPNPWFFNHNPLMDCE